MILRGHRQLLTAHLCSIDGCPLCGFTDGQLHSVPEANLYSELLAQLIGIGEQQLLLSLKNWSCHNCKLIYKKQWLRSEVLRRLFQERVPDHPRGWDVISSRFTATNLEQEFHAWCEAHEQADPATVRQCNRSLTSLILSIPELMGTAEAIRLRDAINCGNRHAVRIAMPSLLACIDQPIPFGRFSGFGSSTLWDYMQARLGRIRRYAELGCPLWGLLPHASQQGALSVYLKRLEYNYWSSACRREGIHCLEHLSSLADVSILDLDADELPHFDVISLFQYLDHVESPLQLIKRLLQNANALAIIFDALEKPLAVQHISGWTPETMQWLATHLHCSLHADFAGIISSGNHLYLLERDRDTGRR